MAFTLLEAAKTEQNPLRQGVVEEIARFNPILANIPIQTILGNAYHYTKEGELPGVGFRGLNEAYGTAAKDIGVLNPEVETLKVVGGEVDVDVILQQARPQESIGDLRALHTSLKVKALSAFVMKTFFKGDSSSDPREFDGLERRATGSQVINSGTDSGGTDLTLGKLDELLDLVDGADMIACNRKLRRKINKLRRDAGQARETVDDGFGRQIDAYAGIPIALIEEDETKTEILGFTEDGGFGGGSITASIYAIKFGADEYCSMLQSPNGVDVRDLGEVPDKPVFRTRIEWFTSPAVFRGRAIGRMKNILNPTDV